MGGGGGGLAKSLSRETCAEYQRGKNKTLHATATLDMLPPPSSSCMGTGTWDSTASGLAALLHCKTSAA